MNFKFGIKLEKCPIYKFVKRKFMHVITKYIQEKISIFSHQLHKIYVFYCTQKYLCNMKQSNTLHS